MAYCSNCGQEVKDGVRFCNNCGAPVNGDGMQQLNAEQGRPGDSEYRYSGLVSENSAKKKKSMLTGLFGSGLLILAVVTFFSDPPILTMALAFIIVAGAIVCLVKKFRLKGLTIAALVIGSFCIFAAIIQATESGWFSESFEMRSSTGNHASNRGTPAIGVDSDLKAFLDSYEDFVDEYVDFMRKYMKDPMNALSMMKEYNDMMKKYDEFAKKCDEYDSDNMSAADAAYYLEVTTRCTQKMLEIYK